MMKQALSSELYADRLLVRLLRCFQENKIPFLSAVILGFLAHGFAFTNKLLNHDELGNLFGKGGTIETGRWGLKLMSLVMPDFSMPWIYGILSVLLVAVAACLLVKLFQLRSRVLQVLLSGLVVTFPALTGTLTYMFTSAAYMAAFLLAVSAVYLLLRQTPWAIGAATVCMTLSLGIYQAYLALAATVLVVDLIRRVLAQEAPVSKLLRRGVMYVLFLLICLALYWVVNKAVQLAAGVGMGSYVSDAVSSGKDSLLMRLVYAYGALAMALVNGMDGTMPTVFSRCLHGIGLVLLLIALIATAKERKKAQNLLLAALVCVLPLAMNCMYLIAGVSSIHTLVLYSNIGIYLLAAVVLEAGGGAGKLRTAAVQLLPLCMALLIVSNTYVANEVGLNLHLRYENSYALGNAVLTQVRMTPGYTEDTPLLLAGTYEEPEFYDRFANIEKIAGASGFTINSWSNWFFLAYYCGAETVLPTPEQMAAVEASQEFAEMPCYPDQGSVRILEGVAVVKFSEQ